MTMSNQPKHVETFEQATARIAELERALDDAINIILKRDDQLTACERRLRQLEEKSDKA